MRKWKVFYHGNKELFRYTIKGTFDGEEEDTKGLLAYENGISEDEITVSIEER